MALTKIPTHMLFSGAASEDLSIDSNTLYIDSSENRVGIANNSPSVALDVTGSLTVSGTITGADLEIDSGTFSIDSSNNRVGIGTTSPAYQLVVDNQAGNDAGIIQIITDNNQAGYLMFGDGDHNYPGSIAYNHTHHKMRFAVGSDDIAMTILGHASDNSFKVGIGTDTPTDELQLKGDTFRLSVHSADQLLATLGNWGNSGADIDEGHLAMYSSGTETVRLATNASSFLTGGDIGIGTTSPSEKLHIKGDGARIEIGSADYTNVYLGRRGSSGADLDTGLLNLKEDGTSKVQIDANGDTYFNGGSVGIGTTSPNSYNSNTNNFVIRDSGSGGMTISTGASSTGYVAFNDGEDTTIEGLIAYNQSNDVMSFRTASTDDRLVIDGSGNVGIGTTSPSQKLEVNGRMRLGGMILQNSSDGGSIGFNRNPADGAYIGDSGLRRFQINGPDSTWGDFLQIQSYNSSGTHQGNITIQDGNLGIGTTSPARELHVHKASSGATSTSNSVLVVEDDDNTELSILGGSSSVLAINFGHSGDNDEGIISFDTTSGSENLGLSSSKDITHTVTSTNSTAGHHIFKSYNTEIMRIDGANNRVGIGTSSPSTPLHVYGANDDTYGQLRVQASADDAQITFSTAANGRGMYVDDSDTNKFKIYTGHGKGTSGKEFTIDNDGKVGIGTTSPSTKLYVYNAGGGSSDCMTVQSGSTANSNVGMIIFRDNDQDYCGQITTNGSTNTAIYNANTSDERLKENITDWEVDALSLFKNIEPKEFNFKSQDEGAPKVRGYIAQTEVSKFPEAFTTDSSEEAYYSYNPGGMVIYLMKALKEQVAINEALEARITALESS